jgi:uncharacterized repeat protein (TIGR01451 family)
MAYDPATGNMVLFGGGGDSAVLGDTWTWDGTTWTQQTPATSPPVRSNATMAYDPATGNMVLFGGAGNSGFLGDTWTWDGTTWTQLSPVTSPPGRDGATIDYDPATGNMVLFGGAGNSGYLNDTWSWDGTTWTEQSPVTSPPGRASATMAYDPATGNIVLFGGYGGFSNLGDTWTYGPSAPQPPTIAMSFGSSSIPLGGSTSLSITLTNPNPTDSLTGVAFTDTLPAGLVVAHPNGAISSCSYTSFSASPGADTVGIGGGTLAAGASCTVSVSVTATSAGVKTNSVTVDSDQGIGNTATASLTVDAPPTIAMSFGVPSIPLGGTTSLSITLTNPNPTDALTRVGFTDTLPSGLVVANPDGASYPCSYTSLSASPGAGTVGIAGGTLAADASCTFSVNVTATSAGVKTNSVTVSSDQGTGNTATASLTVNALHTTTTLSSSVNPSIHHQPVTFTATVTPTDGSGTVAFYAGTKVISHCGTQSLGLVGGKYQATCVDASLTVGTHKITAVYSGDPDYLGSPSSVLTQKVKAFGAPAFITPVSGTPQSSPVGVAFAQPLTAVVTDLWGNVVPGAQVTFRAPSTGPSGTFLPGFKSATEVTDSTGRVTAPVFTANLTVGGPYDVTAKIGAVSGSFVLTNLPPVQDTAVSIVPSQFALAGGGTTPGFLVTATNTGMIPTSGTLTVTDTISGGMSFTGQTLPGANGWNCTFAGQVATCTYRDPIPVGSLNSVGLYVAVTAPPGTVLTDTAVLTPTDPTPQDNTATVEVKAGEF